MAIKGLPTLAPLVKAEQGRNNDAVQNLADPLNSALATLHAAFGGTASRPVIAGTSIGILPKVNLPQGATVQVSGDHLIYKAPSGNTYRLDRQTQSGGSTPTGSISLSQIPPGSNGQVLTTVAGATAWSAATGGTTYTTFGPSGASHATGLVPDPGTTSGTTRFLREDASWVTPPSGTTYATFGASGSSHTTGLVPDPGSSAGNVRYLCENATFQTPPGTTYSTFVASGSTASSGLVPSPGTTAGTTRYLREDATWVAPPAGASGLQPYIEGVLSHSGTLTWSGSGGSSQAYTYTVPSTYNGNTLNWMIITKVACSLLSGTPGTSATFSVTIGGTAVVGTRQLPTYSGGINVSIVDLNVQSLSGTSCNPIAGQTIVVTPGGTFSASTTWRVDIIGYYL